MFLSIYEYSCRQTLTSHVNTPSCFLILGDVMYMSEVLLSLATSLLDSSEITTGTSDAQYLYFDEVNTVDACSSLCCDITMSETCDLISNTEMTAN